MITEEDKKIIKDLKIKENTMDYPKIQQSWQKNKSNITIRSDSVVEFSKLKAEMKSDIFKMMGWEIEDEK